VSACRFSFFAGCHFRRTSVHQTIHRQSTEPVLRRATGRDFCAVAISAMEAEEFADAAAVPERTLNDPAAVVVKRGRSALVVRAELAIGGSVARTAFKRCGARTLLRRLLRGLRTSAARRNFLLGRRLVSLGIDTPRPLLAIWPRWHNLLAPSYLATEWIDGAVPLDAFVRSIATWPHARRRAALRDAACQLGHLIGTLHQRGFSHRDLKSANLLVRENRGQIEVFLIDLDGASRLRFRVAATRAKNLARLQEATRGNASITATLRCRFLRAYLASLGSPADWKAVWRQLEKAFRIPPRPPVVLRDS
jgi:tRNA A-37 threonylcarbamoyl transferase component Bud32